ncbi:MAG: biopolymer transporter ExbD [Pirellulales bacterium]
MSIRFICPQCGKQIAAPTSAAGKRKTCPNCRALIDVPESTPAARPASDPIGAADSAADHPLLLFPNRGDDHGNLIDMTAMVDIVFFLLIFFLVTSMASLEAVINLPTPQSSEGASSNLQTAPDLSQDPNLIVVTIDADDSVWVEDEEAISELDLRAKLRTARQEGDRDGMLIQGQGDSTNGKFVMVLDAGADAGMKEIMFAVEGIDEAAGGG